MLNVQEQSVPPAAALNPIAKFILAQEVTVNCQKYEPSIILPVPISPWI